MRSWAIVSNNCWGAELYRELDMPFNTPTVGLFMYAEDYLRLLQDLRRLVLEPIRFMNRSRFGDEGYPIGSIGGGIELHFLHYDNEEEAERKWRTRAGRLPPDDDDLFVKLCDRDQLNAFHLKSFDELPFKNKVAFVRRGAFDVQRYPWAIEIECGERMHDGVRLWHAARNAGFDTNAWIGVEPTAKRSSKIKKILAPALPILSLARNIEG